jgi:hypothetical protein
MKLLMITSAEDFHKDILRIFKDAGIQNFSESEIEGYKTIGSMSSSSNWFAVNKRGTQSNLFFSFTEEENIDLMFQLLKEFNANLKTNNPIRAVVLPIERSLYEF